MPARALAILAAPLIALGPASAPADESEREPKPSVKLLTETQRAVLRNDAVKVRVRSQRGRKARVEADLLVEGFPDDYRFALGPESRRLRDDRAKVRLPLSARQAEVLAFAEQACDGATLRLEAHAGRATARATRPLHRKGCRHAGR